jgi:imidazolonepropionase-like amidohydrolase
MDVVHRHPAGSVAIAGSSIVAVGDIAGAYQPAETIDCRGRVVMPGSSTHTHAR